jgi:purine-nucleoside phosphorylase
MSQFDQQTIAMMRSVLSEVAQELGARPATQAKIAETLTRKAAERQTSRDELKEIALEAGRTPAP